MRPEKLKEKAEEIIEEGKKPSVQLLSEELDWTEEDVHSCLNTLEKRGEIETYVKKPFNRKIRFVSVKR
ncbi:MAG: hypothetical protein R6V35_01090 [Candidatus Nanohaloarchaea archaeon]